MTVRIFVLLGGLLRANSNFVGCTTGRFAGFSPFRIRPALRTHIDPALQTKLGIHIALPKGFPVPGGY